MNSSTTSLSSSLPGAGSRKRKCSAKNDNTVVVELMERVISAQTKSDENMMELEKRMRMEERQMEGEAQKYREDREFQMQMMRMMMMGPGMHHSFQMPGNQYNLGNLSSMDQSSSSHLIMEQVTCTMPTL